MARTRSVPRQGRREQWNSGNKTVKFTPHAPHDAPHIMQDLDPNTTALVLIDLQKGIVGRSVAPHSGADVLKIGGELADRFRRAGAPVVLVNVGWSPDFKDALRQSVDQPMQLPPGGVPAEFMELADGLKKPGDICITKRQWGAFHGTELDLQLRRRGVRTIGWVVSRRISAWNRRPGRHGNMVTRLYSSRMPRAGNRSRCTGLPSRISFHGSAG